MSIVKPTRCKISQVYFGTTLHMFRKVSPSIIRSLRLYIQHQDYVIQVLWLLASSKQPQNLNDIYLMLYVQPLTPDDGRRDLPKHVVLFQNKINLRCTSGWICYRNSTSSHHMCCFSTASFCVIFHTATARFSRHF